MTTRIDEGGPALPRDHLGDTQLHDLSMSIDLRASLDPTNTQNLFNDSYDEGGSFEAKSELVHILQGIRAKRGSLKKSNSIEVDE